MIVEFDIWYGLQSSVSEQGIVANSSRHSSRHRGSNNGGNFFKSRETIYSLLTINYTTLGLRSRWYLAL
jgi:hypothetical protein